MADPNLPVPSSPASNAKTRLVMVISFLVIGVSVVGYGFYASAGLKQMETRIVEGDFTNVRLESIPATVQENGKVFSSQVDPEKNLTVASLKLVPPGEYKAILVANDGNPQHIEKTELVIAGQDAEGQWHPKSAPQVLERLKAPAPGVAQ